MKAQNKTKTMVITALETVQVVTLGASVTLAASAGQSPLS